MKTNTFRLFISSTFKDFNEERQILQAKVFPHLKEYCQSKGFNFQPIDLRWGVSNEAQLDQKALSLCLEEVQASKNTLHPNFLIMAGNRYGWVPLPYAIERSEFESIRNLVMDEELDIKYWKYKDKDGVECQSNNRKCTHHQLLNDWYKLDENQLPASYILQERKDLSQGEKSKNYSNYLIYQNWGTEEKILTKIVQDAVNKTELSGKDKDKYFTSATEQEVIEGIFNYSYETEYQKGVNSEDGNYKETDKSNVYAYLRNSSCDTELCVKEFEEKEDNLKQKAIDFKDRLVESILPDNIYTTNSLISSVSLDDQNESLNYEYKEIVSDEATEFETSMIRLLKQSIDRHEKVITKDFDINQNQKDFKDEKLKGFIGREKDLEVISDYISGDNNQPLVIYGPSGMGKSALMAKAIDEAIGSFDGFDGEVVYRFVGSTPELNTSVDILISILAEMGIDHKVDKSIEKEEDAIEDFYVKTKSYLSGFKDDIIIFIDAIDQVSNEDKMEWLPEILPSNIKLIISALKDTKYEKDSKYLVSLLELTDNSHKLESFTDGQALLSDLLKSSNRTLTSSQHEYVNNLYENINTPLYLSVASEELRHWKSSDETKEYGSNAIGQDLADSQQGVIKEYIDNLSSVYHHNKLFVDRVLAYLKITRGLSEAELLDIINIDQELLSEVAPDTYHTNTTNSLPIVIWARLHTQLKPFIKLQEIDGQETMSFFHREFNSSISEDIETHEHLIHMLAKLLGNNKDSNDSNRYGEIWCVSMKSYIKKLDDIDTEKDLNHFDVSNVTNMGELFCQTDFNGDISKWDVSNVTDMSDMFMMAYSFKGDISKWDVSNVTDMSNMFKNTSFNGDIGQWDVGNVTNMLNMFYSSQFNGDISGWDVSNVTMMGGMFQSSNFNGDISDWDVSGVTNMAQMFCHSQFSGDISGWDVSNVTMMTSMFHISQFNGDISKWCVSNVVSMVMMFQSSKFNGDISKWDVGNVAHMGSMFKGSQFNGDISKWPNSQEDFSSINKNFEIKSLILDKIKRLGNNASLNNIDVSEATNLNGAFKNTKFNGDISKWVLSQEIDFNQMLNGSVYSGTVTKRVDDSLWVFNYKDGVVDLEKHSKVFFYPNGNKKYELSYVNNELNGVCKMWFNNNQDLHVVSELKDGKQHGQEHIYDTKGNTTFTATYHRDESTDQNGLEPQTDDDGNITHYIEYKDGHITNPNVKL